MRSCAYETERLSVAEWRSLPRADYDPERLPADVAAMLTERVTAPLPPAWHGPYSAGRAARWIEERDAEGATLLVRDKQSGQPLGLVILSTTPIGAGASTSDVRLGYLLAESVWGRGYATELLAGLVAWCRASGTVRALAGGVARDNPASRRVLEKLGFRRAAASGEEDVFELALGASSGS